MQLRSNIEATLDVLGDLHGARVLITGATDGIGRACAKLLAEQGAHITIVARSESKAVQTLADFVQTDVQHDFVIADLSSVQSCYEAVQSLSHKKPFTHCLANAGMSGWTDGQVVQKKLFHVNHTGHFVLITGLVTANKLTNASVVIQSSIAHWQAKDPRTFSHYFADDQQQGAHAYSDSKIANLMFATYLPKWAESLGVKMTARAVHPGFVVTNINKIITENGVSEMIYQMLCGDPKLIALATAHKLGLSQDSLEDAALPMIHAAFNLTEGKFLGPQKWLGLRGYPSTAKMHYWAECTERNQQLWRQTAMYCKTQCADIDWLDCVSRES